MVLEVENIANVKLDAFFSEKAREPVAEETPLPWKLMENGHNNLILTYCVSKAS